MNLESTELPALASKPETEPIPACIDLSLLNPALSEEDMARGLAFAVESRLGCVIVRPSDLEVAVRSLAGRVALGSVVDHPHGFSTTAAKQYAARDFLRRGAQYIETPLNYGKLVSRQFHYLESELLQIAQACHESDARLAVTIDEGRMTEELLVVACRILRRAGADIVSVASPAAIEPVRSHGRERLGVKVRAGIATLDAVLSARAAGCVRMEVEDPAALLRAWEQRLAAPRA